MAVGTSQQRASSGRQEGRARYRHGGHLFLSGAAVSSAANPPCYVFTNNGQAKDQQHLISDQTRRACVHVCTFGMAFKSTADDAAPSAIEWFLFSRGTFLAKLRVRPDRSCNRIERNNQAYIENTSVIVT